MMEHRAHETVWDDHKVELIARAIQQSNRILVGIGAGMANAAGLEPLPLERKLGAGLKPEDYWSHWYPYIESQRLSKVVPDVYKQLAALLADKDYFIIDSNPDGFVQKSGVELSRVYKAQGDMARMQCSNNCQNQSWIGKSHFEQMAKDASYQPVCPYCGAPMIMNVYVGQKGFCDEPYQEKNSAYFRFINGSVHEPLLVLELGVGYTMPELIRFPFEQIVMNHPNATLVRINTMHPLCVEENKYKAICAGVDIAEALPKILEQMKM